MIIPGHASFRTSIAGFQREQIINCRSGSTGLSLNYPGGKLSMGIALMTFIIFFILGCGQRKKEPVFYIDDIVIEESVLEITEFKAIFYDMFSPVETYKLFEHLNIVFDPSILNPVENRTRYNTSNKVAVNLGIYGANMSFCYLFGQTQEVVNYFYVIYRLAENLGISAILTSESEKARERFIYHPDSLFEIASNIYFAADKELKESDRHGAAALIIAGGWIEALYIAGSFYDANSPDTIIEQQILSQKYSLDRLIALLSSHQTNEIISKYLLLIRQMKHVYDKIDILFDQDDLVIDTTRRTLESIEPKYSYTSDDIAEIINLVKLIRADMIN